MAFVSSTRPSKKARLSCSSDFLRCEAPRIEPGSSLESLVHQLALFAPSNSNDPSLASVVDQITILLLSPASEIKEQGGLLWRLHGLVLLHIGFLSQPSPSEKGILDIHRVELLSLGISCLQALCKRGAYRKTSKSLDRDETEEEFTLILRIGSLKDRDTAAISKRKNLRRICWQFVEMLLLDSLALSDLLNRNIILLEKLFFSVLEFVGETKGIDSEERKLSINLLKLLLRPPFEPTPRRLAKIALKALDRKSYREPELSSIFSIRDNVFYWTCLCYSSEDYVPASKDITTLLELIQNNRGSCGRENLSLQAMSCLLLFAQRLPRAYCCEQIMERTAAVILLNGSLDMTDVALTCLQSLLLREGGLQLLLRIESLQKLFVLLTTLSFKCHSRNMATKASNLVLLIVSSINRNQCYTERLGTRCCFEVLLSMIASSETEVPVRERAIQLICGWFEDKTMRIRLIDVYPESTAALAKAASDNFASDIIRENVIKAFWSMVKDDSIHSNALAREKPVLELLVNVASRQDSTQDGPSRRLALCILLRLSKNACNRRILAKQPGLLSSMIRCTRTLQRTGPDHVSLATRSDLKKHILLLARSL